MEPESRFAHLLRPIRDLTENWNINIAKYLEEYLHEIEGITISFDNGASVMNFAEAALVIQGSACVYSKKIEYLHKLVYQTLNMISSKKKEGLASSVDAQGHDADVSAALGQSGDGQYQFLSLDDIKEAKNIDMVEYAGKEHNVALLPRTPLALIPLQDVEKQGSALRSHSGEILGNKQDYKMNTGSIHDSGALLLEPMSRIYIDGKHGLPPRNIPPVPPLNLDTSAVAPEAVTPVANGVDTMEIDDAPEMDMGGGYHSDTEETPKSHLLRRSSRRIDMMQDDVIPDDDTWQLLDAHQPSATVDKPFKKGNSTRIPASLQGKGKKQKNKNTTQLEPLAEFLLHTFYSCYTQFPRQLVKKPLYPEFEVHYWKHQQHVKEVRKKETQKLKSLQKEHIAKHLQSAVDGAGLTEGEDMEQECIPLGDMSDYDDGGGAFGYCDNIDQQRIEDAINSHNPADGYVEQAPIGDNLNIVQSYEDIVRDYVERTLESAMTYAVETELSSRVRQWEHRIRPILEEEEQRPPFDIHKYGGTILTEFDNHLLDDSERMSFKTVAHDKQVHEVCRMFLATLQLANNYNIEIDENDEEEVMWMKLLSRQLPYEAMEEFRAPSLQTTHTSN